MNSAETISRIPQELRTSPWLQPIIELLQEQIEQIATLKKIVEEQKDEIARLKKMPKRPKFRPGGGDPKSRSGRPGNTSGGGGSNPDNKMAPKKVRQEIRIQALDVPQGSRFKGYQEYAIQELEVIPKDVIYRLEVWQASDGAVIRAVLP